jgi:hypothetical protein
VPTTRKKPATRAKKPTRAKKSPTVTSPTKKTAEAPPPPPPEDPAPPLSPEPARDRSLKLEIVLAAALGLAAIVTAWASFRSALVEDEMIVNFNQGIKAVDEAGQAYSAAQQTLVQDQALFLEYAKAAREGDDSLSTYIFGTLMNEGLRAGVEWWQTEDEALTPFDEGSPYHLPDLVRYERLNAKAQDHFDAAAEADEQTDRYDFVTVLAAIVLFFLGLASVVRHRVIRTTFSVMGAVLLLASLILLVAIGLT